MKSDGGAAFPRARPKMLASGDLEEQDVGGMSLRDYFAAAALTGYRCAYHQWYQRVGADSTFAAPDQFAKWAYADADAMLAERSK